VLHPKLEEFIRLFNEKHFFEAHEVLEELWLVTTGEQKLFYKGLIQCAVSLAHWKKNNPRGAHQVGQRSFRILEHFDHRRDTILVSTLVADCEEFLKDPENKDWPQIKTASD
jgi:predicted metal-dependent hydrolase